MTEFIFMLTHHDVTVGNALNVLEEVKDTGVKFVGCKDIGLDLKQYRELFSRMKRYGIESFIEVVTYNEIDHFKAVDLALKVGTDNLIGGMPWYTEKTMNYLKNKGVDLKYFPYIGKISGHPCIQEGEIDETIANGKKAESLRVTGINLLLYRYTGDQKELLQVAVNELEVPLIVAGNVATFEQIDELKEKDVWAFTIGGAVFEKRFIENGETREQIKAVLRRL